MQNSIRLKTSNYQFFIILEYFKLITLLFCNLILSILMKFPLLSKEKKKRKLILLQKYITVTEKKNQNKMLQDSSSDIGEVSC